MKAVQVAAGVLWEGDRVLVSRRPANTHLGGMWEFPGGKLKAHESFPDALVREMKEELGIDIAVGELLDHVRHAYPEKTVELKFFLVTFVNGEYQEPQNLAVAEWRFVTRSQLLELPFAAADRHLIEIVPR